MQLRVNQPNVVFEAFDEEIVLINLETGNYYSVRGSGPAVWTALTSGAAVGDLAREIARATASDAATIERDLSHFADALLAAELVVTSEAPAVPVPAWTGTADAPVLEVYSDMQDLLMLDPIHDVDPTGWPMAKDA